jgi:hypothetical protein
MDLDPRCCGGGNCIINPEGECWCGQVWDGTKMCQYYVNEAGLKVNAQTGDLIDD